MGMFAISGSGACAVITFTHFKEYIINYEYVEQSALLLIIFKQTQLLGSKEAEQPPSPCPTSISFHIICLAYNCLCTFLTNLQMLRLY